MEEQAKLQIWEPVSTSLSICRVWSEKTLSLRSALPPPETMVGSEGLKPMALTAALWLVHSARLPIFLSEKRCSLLSLPPVATMSPAGDSFSPQISCSCARYLKISSGCRRSRTLTYPSLPPEQTRFPELPTEPILPKWMPQYRSNRCFCRSRRARSPRESPRSTLVLPGRKVRPQRESPSPRNSCTLETLVAQPDHRQRVLCRATAICPESDQSSKLRQKSSLSREAGSTRQGWLGSFSLLSDLALPALDSNSQSRELGQCSRQFGLQFYFSSGQSLNLSILGRILGARRRWPSSSWYCDECEECARPGFSSEAKSARSMECGMKRSSFFFLWEDRAQGEGFPEVLMLCRWLQRYNKIYSGTELVQQRLKHAGSYTPFCAAIYHLHRSQISAGLQLDISWAAEALLFSLIIALKAWQYLCSATVFFMFCLENGLKGLKRMQDQFQAASFDLSSTNCETLYPAAVALYRNLFVP